MEFTIKEEPFSWNDNFSEIAQEDFSMIQKGLSYGVCQSIGMALAKLALLEKQGCKVEREEEGTRLMAIGIVRGIEVDGKKYVALEDYQALLKRYEELVPPCSNEEILADVGEDEVYSE